MTGFSRSSHLTSTLAHCVASQEGQLQLPIGPGPGGPGGPRHTLAVMSAAILIDLKSDQFTGSFINHYKISFLNAE